MEKTSRVAKNQPAKPVAVKIESFDMPNSGSNSSASSSLMKHQVDSSQSLTNSSRNEDMIIDAVAV